mgnify:CR=1 FL=1
MTSLFNGSGYYLSDNSASGGKREEDDMLACNHHNGLMLKSVWKKQGGFCMGCGKPLCLPCFERARKFGCEPSIKKFTAEVNESYHREQNAKILGI